MLAGQVLVSALALCPAAGFAQDGTVRHRLPSLARTTVASADEDRYDVRWAKIDVALTNTNTSVSGNVTTRAVVTAATMPAYVFELTPQLTVDSARVNGALVTVTGSGAVRTANLVAPLLQGAPFTAQVWYHGTVSSVGLSSVGLNNGTSPTWGSQVTYTLAEPYEARDWWPCKQSLKDKLDSVDVWVTVPSALKAGSNGVLQAVTPLAGGRSRYEWKHRRAIDYYLVSAAVAPYVDYSFKADLGGGDSVLVQNYVYNNPQTLPFWKANIDTTALALKLYSRLFGRYPYWQEKYGHCMAPLNGGMEHQTMSTVANFGTTLVVHELGHQWFGDHVTCATWSDIWLNEGWATYLEYIFMDAFRGPAAARAYMTGIHNGVLFDYQTGALLDNGTVYVTDTTDEGRIFSNRLTYNKGGSVAHMLRFEAGDDSLFFQSMRAYQQTFGDSTATTLDLQHFLETRWGRPLDTFFRQWIWGEGYPRFSAEWNVAQGAVFLRLNQSGTVPGSVSQFNTPVEIRFSGPSGDTTVRVRSRGGNEDFQFSWNKPVTSIAIDPNDWLLNREGNIVYNSSLGLSSVSLLTISVLPNPSRTAWTARGLPSGAELHLTDQTGRSVWQGRGTGPQIEIPADQLASGMYFLRVTDTSGRVQVSKLVRE